MNGLFLVDTVDVLSLLLFAPVIYILQAMMSRCVAGNAAVIHSASEPNRQMMAYLGS